MAGRTKYESKSSRRPFLFEIDGVEFDTVRRLPGASFVDFVRQLHGFQDGTGRTAQAVVELGDNIHGMFSSVMEPEEFERFWKWAKSGDGPGFETLVEVLSDMVADDADRPTKRPTRSARGPRTTGDTSTDD